MESGVDFSVSVTFSIFLFLFAVRRGDDDDDDDDDGEDEDEEDGDGDCDPRFDSFDAFLLMLLFGERSQEATGLADCRKPLELSVKLSSLLFCGGGCGCGSVSSVIATFFLGVRSAVTVGASIDFFRSLLSLSLPLSLIMTLMLELLLIVCSECIDCCIRLSARTASL